MCRELQANVNCSTPTSALRAHICVFLYHTSLSSKYNPGSAESSMAEHSSSTNDWNSILGAVFLDTTIFGLLLEQQGPSSRSGVRTWSPDMDNNCEYI
jgi:hypothetical protein